MKKLALTIALVGLVSPAWADMDNIRFSIPIEKNVDSIDVTLPKAFHPKLQIESLTVDKDGIITGITLFHNINGNWVLINQQIVNNKLFMSNDGITPQRRVYHDYKNEPVQKTQRYYTYP